MEQILNSLRKLKEEILQKKPEKPEEEPQRPVDNTSKYIAELHKIDSINKM